MDNHRPDYPDNDPRRNPPRVLGTQVTIAVALGATALMSFCVLRAKWPRLYAPRRERRKEIPALAGSLFGWMRSLYSITEEQVLQHAGLDAYVFLGFFKCTIQLLLVCTVFGGLVISPIRLHYTGRYDQDDDDRYKQRMLRMPTDAEEEEKYQAYLWMYTIFTYVFTAFTAYFFLRQTMKVLDVRQKYLGRQNSITDRTIRVSGISRQLCTEPDLRQHIENLGIGQVRNVSLCRNWEQLDSLFDERAHVVQKLEVAWTKYLYGDGVVYMRPEDFNNPEELAEAREREEASEDTNNVDEAHADGNGEHHSHDGSRRRPTERSGFLGLMGPRVDVIDKYNTKLEELDRKIQQIRERMVFEPTGTAFVTMDSVASAQVMAQAVLDPKPHTLIIGTAPAPHDVVWRNLYMSNKERMIRTYCITFVIAIMSVAMVAPVSYLASFLQYSTIRKFMPWLADLLDKSEWALTIVTGILPPLIFTLFNFLIPYIYVYLSQLQGFVSHGEVELSVISKNFFYIFFNMFLVFTAAGAATSYWSFLKDTTQIAYELAKTLQEFSLFYVDLIILQGIGMFPFRLLQLGNVVQFPFITAACRSPRQFRNLYKPPIFNYGIHLPQPILILIIVILYSVISTKILAFGLIYFIFGYYTYKYQLMYVMVHPQHSTGRAWPLIVRRVCIGLILFPLAMAGILALQKAYFLATLLAPLPLLTMVYWYNFETSIVPLLNFIALRAIETKGSGPASTDDLSSEWEALLSSSRRRTFSQTLDEQREQFQRYKNPNMVRPLDGPCVGFDGDELIFAQSDGLVRKQVHFEEWE